MLKTAFITGATGFLGTNLVHALKARHWEVTAIHRPGSNLKYLKPLNITLCPGDIEDLDSVLNSMPQKVDAVFHVAASTNLWSKFNQNQYKTNVVGTQNVIKAAFAKKAGRFIHTSSIAAYGLHNQAIVEHTPSNALSTGINYFVTKYLAEEEVKRAVAQGLDAVILNPAHIVGPFDNHNWAQVFQNVYHGKLPGVPRALGRFTFAPEVANAHITAFDKGRKGQNYLMGGVQASMLDFVNAIELKMGKIQSRKTTPSWLLKVITGWYLLGAFVSGKEPLLTPEKTKLITHNVLCDDTRAREELDFRPVPMDEMVAETYRWLLQENLL